MKESILSDAYHNYRQGNYEQALFLYKEYKKLYPQICQSIDIILAIIQRKLDFSIELDSKNIIDTEFTIVRIDFLKKICKQAVESDCLGDN